MLDEIKSMAPLRERERILGVLLNIKASRIAQGTEMLSAPTWFIEASEKTSLCHFKALLKVGTGSCGTKCKNMLTILSEVC